MPRLGFRRISDKQSTSSPARDLEHVVRAPHTKHHATDPSHCGYSNVDLPLISRIPKWRMAGGRSSRQVWYTRVTKSRDLNVIDFSLFCFFEFTLELGQIDHRKDVRT